MNISVYLDEELLRTMDEIIKIKDISRSKAIREAIKEWAAHEKGSKWSKGFFDFINDPTAPSFPTMKELREGIIEQDRDPFKL